MSLSIRALNGDTTFLLIFTPPIAPPGSTSAFPGSFTILIDPWLRGPSVLLSPKFSIAEHTEEPSVSSLSELTEVPDVVLISQDKPDHCHEETLRGLDPKDGSMIIATPAAAKKIRGYKHFDPDNIYSLQPYSAKKPHTVFRIPISSFSPNGADGEVTIALLPARWDVTGVHNAMGITYRAPSSVLSAQINRWIDIPPTPPLSPLSPTISISGRPITPVSARPMTLSPSPYHDREKPVSVVYSPHGVSYPVIESYAQNHLIAEAALPLRALIHSFDRVRNPWILGGTITYGFPAGVQIAKALQPKVWISAHDEEKDSRGASVLATKIMRFGTQDIRRMLSGEAEGSKGPMCPKTEVVSLNAGEEYILEAETQDKRRV